MPSITRRAGGQRRSAAVLVAALAAALSTVATATATATVSSADQKQLVPAYFHPGNGSWALMCDDMSAHGPGHVAVMNPNSGPGTAVDPHYGEAVAFCQTRGQKVIGYVHTSYGRRTLTAVKADINRYYSFYPAIDGIFLDEMSNDRATERYYRNLYRYVKSKSARNLVVGNPGAPAATSWQLSVPVADTVIVFEGTGESYAAWTPPTWTAERPATAIAHLVHSAAGGAPVPGEHCEKSQSANAGLVYVTDDVLDNPWDVLPPYWSEMLSAC